MACLRYAVPLKPKRIDKYRVKLSRKMCTTAILLYCFHTAGPGVLNIVLYYLEENRLVYLINSLTTCHEFPSSFQHKLYKRRNCNGCVMGSYCILWCTAFTYNLWSFTCTLCTPFQVQRDWTNLYRGIIFFPFYSQF